MELRLYLRSLTKALAMRTSPLRLPPYHPNIKPMPQDTTVQVNGSTHDCSDQFQTSAPPTFFLARLHCMPSLFQAPLKGLLLTASDSISAQSAQGGSAAIWQDRQLAEGSHLCLAGLLVGWPPAEAVRLAQVQGRHHCCTKVRSTVPAASLQRDLVAADSCLQH